MVQLTSRGTVAAGAAMAQGPLMRKALDLTNRSNGRKNIEADKVLLTTHCPFSFGICKILPLSSGILFFIQPTARIGPTLLPKSFSI